MAARYSPSFAKNVIGRMLRGVVDPHPSAAQIARLFEFFENGCAYCGTEIHLGTKDAHLDHLESDATGGTNHISNRVPSCADCNEKEKRDLPWREFLAKKCPDKAEARTVRITEWVNTAEAEYGVAPSRSALVAEAVSLACKLQGDLDRAVEKHRELKEMHTPKKPQ